MELREELEDRHATQLGRRRFLLAGAALPLSCLTVATPDNIWANTSADNPVWLAGRSLFGFSQSPKYMNVGTAGALPLPAQETLRADTQICAATFQDGYGSFAHERQAIGRALGCDADELALTRSTSDALFKALFGLSLRAGDQILTTDQEHAGFLTPLRVLSERYGLATEKVHVSPSSSTEQIVASIEAAITVKTRVIAFSSPTYARGILLPIREIATLAQRHGIVTICDGAHLPGMFPIDLRALGIDFFASAGHKWQCGPLGTGMLYIRNRVSPERNGLALPEFEPMSWFGRGPDRRTAAGETIDIAARVMGLGGHNRPAFVALAKSCEIWDQIGRERIAAQIRANAKRLRELIVLRWGEPALLSPLNDERLQSGIVTFNPLHPREPTLGAGAAQAYVQKLQQESAFIVKEVPVHIGADVKFGIRITPHFWHNEEDMEQLATAMWHVTRGLAAN